MSRWTTAKGNPNQVHEVHIEFPDNRQGGATRTMRFLGLDDGDEQRDAAYYARRYQQELPPLEEPDTEPTRAEWTSRAARNAVWKALSMMLTTPDLRPNVSGYMSNNHGPIVRRAVRGPGPPLLCSLDGSACTCIAFECGSVQGTKEVGLVG